jgi:hypothetical protein
MQELWKEREAFSLACGRALALCGRAINIYIYFNTQIAVSCAI